MRIYRKRFFILQYIGFAFGVVAALLLRWEWMVVLPIAFAVFFIVYGGFKTKVVLEREREELYHLGEETVRLNELRVVITVKNGGKRFREVLEHHLQLGVKVTVYDDASEDGTWEFLGNERRRFPTLQAFPLLKDKRNIHPKAFAIEDAVRRFDEPYLLVLDADSVVNGSTLTRGLALLKRYDVVSLKRRNPGGGFVTQIADTEEVTNALLIATKLSENMFFGSGFFFKRRLFEDLKFEDDTLSEDSEFGFQIRRKRAKRIQLLTLEVREEAPKTFLGLLKQRFKWLLAGSVFNFSRYPLSSWMGTSLFSFAAVGVFFANPVAFSLLGCFVISTLFFSFIAQKISNVSIKDTVWRSCVFSLFYTFMMMWVFAFIVLFHPLLLKRFRFSPTQYR